MAINHNHATVHVTSPYDDHILQLNNKLNKTYIAYGDYGKQKITLQAEQDRNAESYSSANAVSRTISKSSHLYKNSSWDLIDAEENEGFKYSDLKGVDLPKELKEKNETELKAYILKKRNERKSIQKEIQTLNLKRKDYILKHQKETSNALENAMINAIKTQAKIKNYKWQ